MPLNRLSIIPYELELRNTLRQGRTRLSENLSEHFPRILHFGVPTVELQAGAHDGPSIGKTRRSCVHGVSRLRTVSALWEQGVAATLELPERLCLSPSTVMKL